MRGNIASAFAMGCICLLAAAAKPAQLPEWARGEPGVSHRDLQAINVPAAPNMLTVAQALELGFANNAGFRSAIAALLDAQASLRVSRQLYTLTAGGSVQTSDTGADGNVTQTRASTELNYDMLSGGTVSVSALLDRLDSEENSALEIAVRQPLVRSSGRASVRYEALRQAFTNYRKALLRYFLERQDLALDIIQGYFGVVLAEQRLAIQEQGLTAADMTVKDAEARLREGMARKIDVTRAQILQATRRLGLTSTRLSYQDRLDALLKTLGLQVGTMPQLTTRVVHKPLKPDVESLVPEAFSKRPELAIEELDLQDAQAALRLSRNRSKPSLELFGSAHEPLGGADNETEWTVGIQTSIPINSRSLAEAVRRSERAWLLAQRGYTELRQGVVTQVRQRVRGLESQQATLEILRQTLEVAREQLRLAEISVEEGVGQYRDKTEAQDAVTTGEQNLLNAQIQYYFSVLDLRRAVGQDVLQGLAEETQEAKPEEAQSKPGG